MEKSFKFLKLIIICISTLLISHFSLLTSLFAEEKIKIEEVVVTATRIEEAIEETTSKVVVIKAEDIKKMNIQFVTDVLRKIPELNLVQHGGTGKLATVLLRGGDARHVLVMIDGVKVKSTTTGSFDFSGIKVNDIERIEIVKGPQSTLYGSEAMAGVINIITKKGEDKPKIDASFESGSYGMYKPSLTVSGGNEKLDYRLTGTYFHTDGISAAKEGTEKDGYKNTSISWKFGFRPVERLELELSGRYYDARAEIDAFGRDDLNYVQYGNHYILSGKLKFYPINIWEQILTVSRVADSLKYRDPDTAWHNADIITGMDTIDWQHNLYIFDAYTLTAGVEYREEEGENIGVFDRKVVDNKALYLNNKLKVFKDSLVLNAGLRYDDHETFGAETTYRLGAVYDIKPAGLRLRSSYGTGFRAPTLNELFYQDPWGSRGNLNLRPERSTSWEVGAEKDILELATISLTYFNQYYRDLIQWVEVAPWAWQPQNVVKAEIEGIEATASLKVTESLSVKAGYTYLDTEDKATGKRLLRRPADKFTVSTGLSGKNYSFIADYTFVGERDDFQTKLAPYSIVNLSGSYNITKTLSLFARVENLLDEDYEEAGGYGTPGLSIFGGIRTSF